MMHEYILFQFLQKNILMNEANTRIDAPCDPGLPERYRMKQQSRTSRYPSYMRCAAQALDECPPTEKYITEMTNSFTWGCWNGIILSALE